MRLTNRLCETGGAGIYETGAVSWHFERADVLSRRAQRDAADADAICEAVTRPNMRFVPVKTEDQQIVLVLHRSRDLLMRQRTMALNAIRAHLAEFGIVAAQGARRVTDLVRRLAAPHELALPVFARSALLWLAAQLDTLAEEIGRIKRQLMIWHRESEASRRLETIPGVGLITATALAASVPDPSVFKSGRQFAAWVGLVPRQNSSGGKERLGRVSKMGNGYLRKLLVVGATSVTRRAPVSDTDRAPRPFSFPVAGIMDVRDGLKRKLNGIAPATR